MFLFFGVIGLVCIAGLCIGTFAVGYAYGFGEQSGLLDLLDEYEEYEVPDNEYGDYPEPADHMISGGYVADSDDTYDNDEERLDLDEPWVREMLSKPHPNARVLPSGVAVLNMGDPMPGRHPKSNDLVGIDYEGWDSTGKYLDVYDEANDYDETIALTKLPKGIAEAVQTMRPDEYIRVWIPEGQGFKNVGAKGMQVFEIELYEILPKDTSPLR